MPQHERSQSVAAPAEALFDYLSDIGNLPRYFARMTSARPGEGETVQVTARLPDGQEVEGEAWFRVNQDANRIEWGSQGPNDYQGWLEVSGDRGGSASMVHVHISTQRVDAGEIDRGLVETLAEIKRLVEDSNGEPSLT